MPEVVYVLTAINVAIAVANVAVTAWTVRRVRAKPVISHGQSPTAPASHGSALSFYGSNTGPEENDRT